MGQATSKGNEVKSEMKQPSDMPTPRFESGGSDLWSNMLPLDHGGAPPYTDGPVLQAPLYLMDEPDTNC